MPKTTYIVLAALLLFLAVQLPPAAAAAIDDLLVQAVLQNDEQRALAALLQGADPNYVRRNRPTPLAQAAWNANSSLVRLLLEHGADPNLKTATALYREPPLNLAILSGDANSAELLLQFGADVNAPREMTSAASWLSHRQKSDGAAPLLLAVPSLRLVNLLLAHGADANQPNKYGYTPLMAAADSAGSEQRCRVAAALLQFGADPAAVDERGNSALRYAILRNFSAMVDLLLPLSPPQ